MKSLFVDPVMDDLDLVIGDAIVGGEVPFYYGGNRQDPPIMSRSKLPAFQSKQTTVIGA
jgi:hypothetical protein